MDELEPPVTDVRFPAMRQQTLMALIALADPEYQERVWIQRHYPRDGFYDDLTMNINVLYDNVLPEPQSRVGTVLRSESESAELLRLEQVLGPLIDDLGDASDGEYISDRRWSDVVAAAATAAAEMKSNDA